jgi:hypothetical protein
VKQPLLGVHECAIGDDRFDRAYDTYLSLDVVYALLAEEWDDPGTPGTPVDQR